MDEDIVADITGRFILSHGGENAGTPVEGRIVMSDQRLVLATGSTKETIPLSRVIDVNVGTVPNHVKQFFRDTATIGYEIDGETRTAVIESSDDKVDTLVAILFRCLLNGRRVAVKHPARVGGRVKDTSIVLGNLRIRDRSVEVRTDSDSFSIDVATVMNIDRTNRIGDSDDRATLVIKHSDPETGRTKTTLIAPAKSRCVNLLARYFRLEYDEIREDVAEIDLTNPEKRVLVSVHATGGDVDFTNMLDGDPAYVTNVLNSVRNKNLIVENGDGITLTPRGRIVVSQRIEDVNA